MLLPEHHLGMRQEVGRIKSEQVENLMCLSMSWWMNRRATTIGIEFDWFLKREFGFRFFAGTEVCRWNCNDWHNNPPPSGIMYYPFAQCSEKCITNWITCPSSSIFSSPSMLLLRAILCSAVETENSRWTIEEDLSWVLLSSNNGR